MNKDTREKLLSESSESNQEKTREGQLQGMKTKKNLMTALLTLVIMCMCATSVFATSSGTGTSVTATDGTTATLNVATANAGDSLKAYKVIAATYTSATNNLDLQFTETFKAFQASTDGTAYKDLTVDQYCAYANNGSALKSVLGAFTKYVRTSGTAADYSQETNAAGTAVFENVAMGQYIITGSGSTTGALVYQTVTAEVVPFADNGTYKIYSSYDVTMKTTKPTGEKTVSNTTKDGEKDTASIGDELTYTITTTMPTYPEGATNKTLYMGDTLSNGLSLEADTIKVYGVSNDVETQLIKDADYKVTISGQKIYIDLIYDQVKGYQSVKATYNVILNENAKIGTAQGNDNSYDLYYSNDPFNGNGHEPGTPDHPDGDNGYGHENHTTTVYTYRVMVTKYKDGDESTKLVGAEFDVKDSDGNIIAHIVTDENGFAAYTGLKTGTYTLIETKAPTGYKLDTNPISVTLTEANATQAVTTTTDIQYTSDVTKAQIKTQARDTDGNLLYIDDNNTVTTTVTEKPAYVESVKTTITEKGESGTAAAGTVNVDVANKPGSSLPTTGGMGTILFTMIGCAIIAVTVILYTNKKRTAGSAK